MSNVLLSASSSDGSFEDGCSICLDSFSSLDPPAVTKCNHDYHFQCILEWSQRSNECPICSQHLFLKDHTSQELIAESQSDRIIKSKHNSHSVEQDINANNDGHQEDDPDNEKRLMGHFTTVSNRARNISTRRRQMAPVLGQSKILPSIPTLNRPKSTHAKNFSEMDQNLVSCLSNIDSSTSVGLTTVTEQASLPMSPSFAHSSENVKYSAKSRSSTSEFASFSESIRSKISSASIKYKESISKNTRGLKEKLMTRNESVNELRKGIQREMSTSIAGLARMIERLDFKPKQAGGASASLSSVAMQTPNLHIIQKDNIHSEGIAAHLKSSDPSPFNTNGRSEV